MSFRLNLTQVVKENLFYLDIIAIRDNILSGFQGQYI